MAELNSSSQVQLIWIDSAPLIQAEHKRYLAAVKRLTETQARLDLHAKSDEPRYALWVQTEFASEISSIRLLQERYFELAEIVEFVEDFVSETGGSCRAGYREYLEMKRAEELLQKMRQQQMEEERKAREEAGDGSESDTDATDENEAADDSSDENFSKYESDFRSSRSNSRNGQHSHHFARSNSSKKSQDIDAEVKTLYRQLAKRLHPDINGGLSPEETEMWFEVQQAYDDRDIDRLEALLALSDRLAEEREEALGAVKPGKFQSLGRLKSMLKNLTRKIRNVQRGLKKAKQTPAWDFSKVQNDPKRYSKLKVSITTEFNQVVRDMNSDVRHLEKVVARWKRG